MYSRNSMYSLNPIVNKRDSLNSKPNIFITINYVCKLRGTNVSLNENFSN